MLRLLLLSILIPCLAVFSAKAIINGQITAIQAENYNGNF